MLMFHKLNIIILSKINLVKYLKAPYQLYQVYQLVATIDPVDGVIIRVSCIDYQLSQ